MPTIVDSLIVRLGIDPAGIKPGADSADSALKRVQKGAKDTAESFSQIRSQVLSLFALFTGGRGIKEFTSYLATTNAATGRLALTTGMATEKISAWQGMFRSVGGSASSASASLGAFSRALENIGVIPESAKALLPAFNRWGINPFGKDGKPLTADEAYDKFNEAISREHTDPREAASVLSELPGIDPSAIILMMKSRKDFLETQTKALGWGTTKEQAAAGARIVEQTGWLQTAYEHLGTVILTKVEPLITKVNKGLYSVAEWARDNPGKFDKFLMGVGPAMAIAFGPLAALPALFVSASVAAAKFYEDWQRWNATGIGHFSRLWTLITNVKDYYSGKTEPTEANKKQARLNELMQAKQKAATDLLLAQAALSFDDVTGPLSPDELKKRKAHIEELRQKIKDAEKAYDTEKASGTAGASALGADFDARMRGHESGKMEFNKMGSGAYGPYQFMPGTWSDVRNANPGLNLPADMTAASREQHEAAYQALKAMNAKALNANGIEASAANMLLAHQMGAAGAIAILKAAPGTPMQNLVSSEAYRLNPNLQGKTAGDFIKDRQTYMAGVAPPGRPQVVSAGYNPGAASTAVAAGASSTDNSRSSNVSVNVDNINLVTPDGADAQTHAKQFLEALDRQAQANLHNMGPI